MLNEMDPTEKFYRGILKEARNRQQLFRPPGNVIYFLEAARALVALDEDPLSAGIECEDFIAGAQGTRMEYLIPHALTLMDNIGQIARLRTHYKLIATQWRDCLNRRNDLNQSSRQDIERVLGL